MKNWGKLLGIGGSSKEEAAIPSLDENIKAGQEETVISEASYEGLDEHPEYIVQEISVEMIQPNPFQPRRMFHDESLQELSSSIKEFGVIQPLLVRRLHDQFELIAGERRLRASKLAGLELVPVIVKELDDKEMAELALIENLQREDLHYLEEALGYQQLLGQFGLTQDELAQRVGKNQSTIANKLRLLKLAPAVQDMLVNEKLTERHARSLLKLDDAKSQMEVLDSIRGKSLNVRETEELIEDVLEEKAQQEKKKTTRQNVVRLIKDVRIYLNTIQQVLGEMKKAGIPVKIKQEQDDEYVMLQIKIAKKKSGKQK